MGYFSCSRIIRNTREHGNKHVPKTWERPPLGGERIPHFGIWARGNGTERGEYMDKWQEYERRKQIIKAQARNSSEYERLIQELVAELKV